MLVSVQMPWMVGGGGCHKEYVVQRDIFLTQRSESFLFDLPSVRTNRHFFRHICVLSCICGLWTAYILRVTCSVRGQICAYKR